MPDVIIFTERKTPQTRGRPNVRAWEQKKKSFIPKL